MNNQTGEVNFHRVTPNDDGVYVCKANNTVGSASTKLKLKVFSSMLNVLNFQKLIKDGH